MNPNHNRPWQSSIGIRRAAGRILAAYLLMSVVVSAARGQTCPNWILRSPANSPSARQLHAMAYDSARGVTVLFGGGYNDTWEWNGTNWTQRSPATHPSARSGHAMAYDSGRGKTVLFGGDGNDTWEWDGTNWTQRSPATSPPARTGHGMAYDSARGVTVMYGGTTLVGPYTTFSDTWEWDGTNWTQRTPATNPGQRTSFGMAYDIGRGFTVLYGDQGAGIDGDFWTWNGTNWTDGGVFLHDYTGLAMAYDTALGASVMFGGQICCTLYLDWTVEYPGGRLNLVTSPSARTNLAMAYDSARGVIVMFGGKGGDPMQPIPQLFNDTWELSTILPCLSAALDGSCHGNGRDIQLFVNALLSGSTAPSDVCQADFSGNGSIDMADIPGFAAKLLGP